MKLFIHFLLSAFLCGFIHAASPRPNFLVITWEDVSPHFGCYGDKLAHTPTIDRLAAEGIRFDEAYAVAGVCAPSRIAIISARWPVSLVSQHMRSDVKLPPDFRRFTVPPQSLAADAGLYHEGKLIAPLTNSDTLTATLPATTKDQIRLELRGQGWVPMKLDPNSKDPRTLGVQVSRVEMRAADAGANVFDANTGEWIK